MPKGQRMAVEWYYAEGSEQRGPVSAETLQELIRAGTVPAEARVWREGMAEWVPANTVAELREAMPAASGLAEAGGMLGYDGGGSSMLFTARAMIALGQTQPWVRFMSVILFIMAGLMILGGMCLGGLALAGAARMHGPDALLALIYFPIGLLYLPPAVFLWRYADGIRDTRSIRPEGTLERAMEAQKSFWKYTGILTLVVMCLYAVIIVAVAVVGGLSAARVF